MRRALFTHNIKPVPIIVRINYRAPFPKVRARGTVTRYLPKNSEALHVGGLKKAAGRGAPNQIGTST